MVDSLDRRRELRGVRCTRRSRARGWSSQLCAIFGVGVWVTWRCNTQGEAVGSRDWRTTAEMEGARRDYVVKPSRIRGWIRAGRATPVAAVSPGLREGFDSLAAAGR